MTRALVGLASLLLGCASWAESGAIASVDDAASMPAVPTIPRETIAPAASEEIPIADDASLRVHVYGCGHAGCAGPTFELTLHADGRVEWIGIDDVGFLGADTQSIDPERIAPILEIASLIRWDLVPADFHASPGCGSDGLRLMWTFDDGDEIATGYDDRAREQPHSVDEGPACIAPELKPLRFLDARVLRLLRELEYIGRPRHLYRDAWDWPDMYLPLVADHALGPAELRREQRDRIRELVREAYDPGAHMIHLQMREGRPAEIARHVFALLPHFARAGVPSTKVALWIVPARLAWFDGAIARVVPTECVTVRASTDAVIDCDVP